MRLIIHIGAQKTGTTSIQNFLKLNEESLKKQSILIPNSIRYINTFNHRWICGFAYKDNILNNIKSLKNIYGLSNILISEKISEFKKEIDESDSDLCIISSEHLSISINSKKEVEKLKNVLEDTFDDIKILIYIRRPIDQAISLLSTQIKGGRYITSFSKNYTLGARWFRKTNNIKKILRIWESNFPKNLMVRIFDSKEFYEDNLVKDFCKNCKIFYRDDFLLPDKKNRSLDLEQMKYINYFNKLIKLKRINISSSQIDTVKTLIRKNIKSKNFLKPSREEYYNFEKFFNSDEAWIRKKYFPHRDYIWSNEINDFRKTKNIFNKFSDLEFKNLNLFFNRALKVSTIRNPYLRAISEFIHFKKIP